MIVISALIFIPQRRISFARGMDSDHVALLNAYEGWVESLWSGQEREYVNHNYLHRGTLNMIEGTSVVLLIPYTLNFRLLESELFWSTEKRTRMRKIVQETNIAAGKFRVT